MSPNYGKELSRFIFDGSLSQQDTFLINASFIIYEKGLLVEGLPPLTPVFVKWREISFPILEKTEVPKRATVTIDFENEDCQIVAESKDKTALRSFFKVVSRQKDKYGDYAELKELKVDLEELSIMMATSRVNHQAYLDTKTGEICYLPCELDERVYDEEYVSRLPQWEQEMVGDVKAIYEDEEGRYEFIPERVSADAYETMVEFAKDLDNLQIANELFDALDGKGAFRRFKNILRAYPAVEIAWCKFQTEAEKQEAIRWLWSIGIEPVEGVKRS